MLIISIFPFYVYRKVFFTVCI